MEEAAATAAEDDVATEGAADEAATEGVADVVDAIDAELVVAIPTDEDTLVAAATGAVEETDAEEEAAADEEAAATTEVEDPATTLEVDEIGATDASEVVVATTTVVDTTTAEVYKFTVVVGMTITGAV